VCLALTLCANTLFTPVISAAQTQNVPRGTRLKVILNNDLSTKTTDEGDQFEATVAEAVRVDGRTLIPRGSTIEGTVTEVERAKRLAGLAGKAKLTLRFDRIRVRGQSRPIHATVVSVHDPVEGLTDEDLEDSDVGDEGEVEADTDTKDVLTKGAIGVAAGALLGALFGNVSRGVIIGSIGGAVAILAPKGKDVILKEGTGLTIRLDRDLNLAIT
jgi:hypothetical protein